MNNHDYLYKALANGRLFHAYILVSSNYENQLNMLKKFIKDLNCLNSNHACGVCEACVSKSYLLDFHIVESQKQIIGKEDILSLFSKIANKSSFKKVYLIKEADKMNHHAQNTLLKTLEEPYDNTYAFLVTDSIQKLLPTIVSRCIVLNFDSLVKKPFIDDISYLKDEVKRYQIAIDDNFEDLFVISKEVLKVYSVQKDIAYLLEGLIYKKFSSREECRMIVYIMICLCEMMLHYKVNECEDIFSDLIEISDNLEEQEVIELIDSLLEAKLMFDYNVNYKLILDKVFIERS